MTNVGTYTVERGVGVIAIDYPPVNALGADVRRAIDDGLTTFGGDAAVDAIVIICEGRTFFAGADIREFGQEIRPPFLNDIFLAIEASTKPVISAIHGTALGGGYELAMVCHYRIAVPSAKVGQPEVKLGIPPGAGGTQRLPRLIGVEAALEIISSGDPVPADRALALGMIEALAEEGELRRDAVAFARRSVDEGWPLTLVRDREDKILPARGRPEIYSDFLARNAERFRGFKAYPAIVDAVRAAAELPFDEGYAVEQRWSGELIASPDFAAQQYYFFAARAATKGVGLEALLSRDEGSVLGRLSACFNRQVSDKAARKALYDYGFPGDPSTVDVPDGLADRLLYPLVNEGAAMIDEGLARAAEIDVAAIKGMGWPVYRGGPMFWADQLGLGTVVAGLRAMGIVPAPLLVARAENGGQLTAA